MSKLAVNVLTVGYYDDFARFFLAIKKEIKDKNPEVNFVYFSIYLSGFLYFLFRFNKVSFFSFKVWLKTLIKFNYYKNKLLSDSKYYKGINIEKVIAYHALLNNKNIEKYKLQALSYIDTIESYLLKNKVDLLLLSGDSRLCIQVFDALGEQMNIPRLYFEQGPFKTTIIDGIGVNANSSFRNSVVNNQSDLSLHEKQKNVIDFLERDKGESYKRNPFYRGADYLFQKLFLWIKLLPIDIAIKKQKKQISVPKYSNLSKKIDDNKYIYLLILQVPFDANMVYHSPFYNNHYEIVKDVFNNIPVNSQLIVREHPLYKRLYEKELYNFMFENNISIDQKELNTSINNADVVVVNNSTVGIEAVAKLKSIVVLGDSYYDNERICLKLKTKEDLKIVLSDAQIKKRESHEVFNYLFDFVNNYLIKGHFRDQDLAMTSEIIVNKIYDKINEK